MLLPIFIFFFLSSKLYHNWQSNSCYSWNTDPMTIRNHSWWYMYTAMRRENKKNSYGIRCWFLHLQSEYKCAMSILKLSGETCCLLLFYSFLKQFIIYMFTKMETERFSFIRHNWKKLRSEETENRHYKKGQYVTRPQKNVYFATQFRCGTLLHAWRNSRCII